MLSLVAGLLTDWICMQAPLAPLALALALPLALAPQELPPGPPLAPLRQALGPVLCEELMRRAACMLPLAGWARHLRPP